MHRRPGTPALVRRSVVAALALVIVAACATQNAPGSDGAMSAAMAGTDGPADQGPPLPQRVDGDIALGREVARYETFGNEGFWTDAVRLPAGLADAHVTPLQALQLGLDVNIDMVDAATKRTLGTQLQQDPSGRSSSILNDPAMTTALVNANAVIGFSARNGKVGATCVLCHHMIENPVFSLPGGGAIGTEVDGPANHNINLGKIFAPAANSRAMYPGLQLAFRALGGKTLGRAPTGLNVNSTEAEVDAYLSNPAYYPVGTFDDSFDGNGNSVHNSELVHQNLAAPYGSEGTTAKLDNFSNLVYTSLFDLTMLTTPSGRAFVHGYPYVLPQTRQQGLPSQEDNPLGVRVDDRKLLALSAYMASLQERAGERIAADVAARGRETFRTAGCTGCHNLNQGRAVPTTVHAMKEIFPGDNPVIIAQRDPPLNPVMNTAESTFDDKAVIVNASIFRGEKRGGVMPLCSTSPASRCFCMTTPCRASMPCSIRPAARRRHIRSTCRTPGSAPTWSSIFAVSIPAAASHLFVRAPHRPRYGA
jgi:hypothetical protein